MKHTQANNTLQIMLAYKNNLNEKHCKSDDYISNRKNKSFKLSISLRGQSSSVVRNPKGHTMVVNTMM